jgi:hypothetical protein
MRILLVATKAPTPITDGGRAVTKATIEVLSAAGGADVTVVTPLPIETASLPIETSFDTNLISDDLAASSHENRAIVRSVQEQSSYLDWTNSIVRSLRSGKPVTVERHSHAPLAARVAELIREEPPFDVVHAEQLQALAIAGPARRAGLPCVLRAQNVESAVWDDAARHTSPWRATPMRLEARRIRRFEAAAIADADATIALSTDDAAAFAAMNPSAAPRITAIPPPIPAAWLGDVMHADARSGDGRVVEGRGNAGGVGHAPAVEEARRARSERPFLWLGSAGWAANDAGRQWLLDDVWPAIAARMPDARLHLSSEANTAGTVRGSSAHPSIVWRGAPGESAEAFLPGGVLLIPMRTASGVRMRLLEAWARGVPVIASPAAVAGLDTEDGRDVLIAADSRAFAEAAARVTADPSLRERIVRGGRATLARRHDPATIAAATLDVYRQAIERKRSHHGGSR